jgi:hypothetical protein
MIRKLAETTIDAYTHHVRRFYDCIGKPIEAPPNFDARSIPAHPMSA